MKHGIAFRKLGRTMSHRNIMLRNLVSSLLEHEQIKTTVPKAKETARLAEKIITLGKRGDEWARTEAQAFLYKHDIVMPRLFGEYAQRYAARPGGYTRIHLYGNRPGDNAPHAVVELIDGPRDLKFELTARAVGRETVEAALGTRGSVSSRRPLHAVPSDANHSRSPLRDLTRRNLTKVLRFRPDEDKTLLQKKAAEWANRMLSEARGGKGLRHHETMQLAASEEERKAMTQSPDSMRLQQRYRPFRGVVGKRHLAGERLLGVKPSRDSSPLAMARGKLGHPRAEARSALWEAATRHALSNERARLKPMNSFKNSRNL